MQSAVIPHGPAAELDRSAAEYAAAADRFEALGGDLLTAFAPYARWTSAATHAVLPLLASDAGVAVQAQTGIASHRRRFGAWEGGFWLPECAHAPWLDPLLEDLGVRATCVELTGEFGLGDGRHLAPLVSDDGPLLWPIDRQTIALVWSDSGYPAHPAYRDYHRMTDHHHRVWSNGGELYDRPAALAVAHEHARDFVARVKRRVADGGLCVCALDTELLGHWWYEGVAWLEAVIEEAASRSLALCSLDDALARHEPVPAPRELGVTSWGARGDLHTWSAPPVAELAWRARTAELRVLASGTRPSDRSLRELLALQASDWAFLTTNELAGDYPTQRAAAHTRALELALADGVAGAEASAGVRSLRSLAPDLAGWLY